MSFIIRKGIAIGKPIPSGMPIKEALFEMDDEEATFSKDYSKKPTKNLRSNNFKRDFPFGKENKNIIPLHELLEDDRFINTVSAYYKHTPFLLLVRYFQSKRFRLGDPTIDGNML